MSIATASAPEVASVGWGAAFDDGDDFYFGPVPDSCKRRDQEHAVAPAAPADPGKSEVISDDDEDELPEIPVSQATMKHLIRYTIQVPAEVPEGSGRDPGVYIFIICFTAVPAAPPRWGGLIL
jgi:hypothetical protein